MGARLVRGGDRRGAMMDGPAFGPGEEARIRMADIESNSLPENAYQPLKDGEIYMPLVPTGMAPP